MIETLEGVNKDTLGPKYQSLAAKVEAALDTPNTPDIPIDRSVFGTEQERLLAWSLGTANMPRTIALLERALYETQGDLDDFGGTIFNLSVSAWAYGAMSREPLSTRLVDLYIDNIGTELGERIINLAVAKLDRDSRGWQMNEDLDALAAARIPHMLVEAARRFSQPNAQTEQTQQRDINLPGAVVNLLRDPGGLDIQPIIKTVLGLWRNDDTLPFADTVMDAVLENDQSAAHLLRRWGLNPSELENAWKVGYGQDKYPDDTPRDDKPTVAQYRTETVRLIKELERECPGTCRILRRHTKLRNFARHTKDVLLGQRESLGGKHYKHNVAIPQAVSDNNGAAYANRAENDALFKKLTTAGVGVYFVEYKDKAELEELLREWIESRPGETFSIMAPFGHGEEFQVESNRPAPLSRSSDVTYITVNDLRNGPLGKLIAQVASPDLVIPMNSCRTGANKVLGVAARLYRAVRVARVIAPPEPASMYLQVEASEGQVTSATVAYSRRVRGGPKKWVSQSVQPVEFPAA